MGQSLQRKMAAEWLSSAELAQLSSHRIHTASCGFSLFWPVVDQILTEAFNV